MDKKIIDALIKFGLITNTGIDSEKYKDVDDLISKGVITIPGAKATIDRLIKDIAVDIKNETLNIEATTIDATPIESIDIVETVEEAVEETVEEAVEETVEEAVEETVEEAVEETVEEAVEETKTNKRKSKKSE